MGGRYSPDQPATGSSRPATLFRNLKVPLPPRSGSVARMIRVTPRISIDEQEIEESFIRASGPGGQNVNKVSSAVQIRFDVRRSPSLPEASGCRRLQGGG
jgi:RF-1 domain